jgi:hypothetical protein
MTNHVIFDKSHTTGPISGEGTAYTSGNTLVRPTFD